MEVIKISYEWNDFIPERSGVSVLSGLVERMWALGLEWPGSSRV